MNQHESNQLLHAAQDCYFALAKEHPRCPELQALFAAIRQATAEAPHPLKPRYGCPQGHTRGITASFTIDIDIPCDLVWAADEDETTNVDLGCAETDNWSFNHYYCPGCEEPFHELVALSADAPPTQEN